MYDSTFRLILTQYLWFPFSNCLWRIRLGLDTLESWSWMGLHESRILRHLHQVGISKHSKQDALPRAGLTSMQVMPWHGAPGSGGPRWRHKFFYI